MLTRLIKKLYRSLFREVVRSNIHVRRPYVRKFGLIKGLIAFSKITRAQDGLISVSIPQCKHPIFLRGNTSDISVFRQIFLEEDYDLKALTQPRVIVDAGANVGCSTIYFANKYPAAVIFAIEPEESNYEMLRKNTTAYANINTIKAAIWNTKTFFKIANPNDKKWSFRVQECQTRSDGCIEAVTVEDLLRLSPYGAIDILKLDIEGAEKQIFHDDPPWLEKIGTLMIELHERYSEGCTEVLYRAISKYEFEEQRRGEKIILQKKSAGASTCMLRTPYVEKSGSPLS